MCVSYEPCHLVHLSSPPPMSVSAVEWTRYNVEGIHLVKPLTRWSAKRAPVKLVLWDGFFVAVFGKLHRLVRCTLYWGVTGTAFKPHLERARGGRVTQKRGWESSYIDVIRCEVGSFGRLVLSRLYWPRYGSQRDSLWTIPHKCGHSTGDKPLQKPNFYAD